MMHKITKKSLWNCCINLINLMCQINYNKRSTNTKELGSSQHMILNNKAANLIQRFMVAIPISQKVNSTLNVKNVMKI